MENILLDLNFFKHNIDPLTYRKNKPNEDSGFYVPDDFDKAENKYKRQIRILSLMLTEDCNLRCTYCFELHKNPRKMTLDDAKRAIDILFGDIDDERFAKFAVDKRICLNLMGGEPLLEDKLAYDAIKYFEKKINDSKIDIDWIVWIPTNGTYYFSEYSQKIVNEFGNRLELVVSLDGCKECHDSCRIHEDGSGSYDEAKKAYDHYRKNHIKIASSKFTISPFNLKYFEKSLKEFVDDGVINIFSNWEQEDYYSPELANQYYKACVNITDYILKKDLEFDVRCSIFNRSTDIAKDQWSNWPMCDGCGHELSIFPGGDVYSCNRLAPISLKDKNCEGMKLGNIWEGLDINGKYKENFDQVSRVDRVNTSPYKCYNCPLSSHCNTCIGDSYYKHGTIFQKDTIESCNMFIADHLARIYAINMIYRKHEQDDSGYFFKSYKCYVPKSMAIPIIGEDEYNKLKLLSKERI